MQFGQLKRREFIALLGGMASGWPLAARAQQATKVPQIGILSPGRSELHDPNFNMLNALLQGLHELGYTEGQNLAVERQFAEWSSDRLRELAAELISRKPNIIIAFSTTAALPAKQATSTIPIVAVAMADPVADELVASLGRECDGDDFSWPGADRQAAAVAARGRSWALACGGPLAPPCIQRAHDGRRIKGGRGWRPHRENPASTRAGR